MNKFLILLSAILLSAAVSAQEKITADSLAASKKRTGQPKETGFKPLHENTSDSLLTYHQAVNSTSFLHSGATLLRGSNISKYGIASLSYQQAAGHFRVAQEAEKTSSAAFSTEGVSTLEKFKLYGYFSFKRSWDDSLAFNQKGIKDANQPAYFIAGKAGDYERQTYTGGGIISYALKDHKLFLATGVDYLYNTTAGSVDPRALITNYKLIFSPELSYQTGEHIIGAGVSLGYGSEKIGIAYKNKDFDGSLLYPSRVSYLNYGYGFITVSKNNFSRNNTYSGFNLQYAGKLADWKINSKFSYLVMQENSEIDRTNTLKAEKFESYQLQTYQVDLLAEKRASSHTQQLNFHLLKERGDDKLTVLAARNYFYNHDEAYLSYSYLNRNRKGRNTEWAAGINYQNTYSKDAAASHQLKYNYISPELSHTQYWKGTGKDLISAELGVMARLPLTTAVNVPETQETLFTRGVVYPDFYYWSAKAGQLQFKFNYITDHLIKKFRTGLSLKTSYLKPLDTIRQTYTSTFIPAKGYAEFYIALNLYL